MLFLKVSHLCVCVFYLTDQLGAGVSILTENPVFFSTLPTQVTAQYCRSGYFYHFKGGKALEGNKNQT